MNQIAFIYSKRYSHILAQIKKDTRSLSFEYIDYEIFIHQKMRHKKVLISGDIDEIKTVFRQAIRDNFEVAVIPDISQVSLQESFSLSKNILDNLNIALTKKAKPLDILYANGHMVLYSALVGEAPPLNYSLSKYRYKNLKERIILLYQAYKKIKSMHHTKIKITTHKAQVIETIATGIVVIEQDNKTFAANLIKDTVSANDSKLDALIISPNSIIEYLKFIAKSIFLNNKKTTLPSAIGYVKSENIFLESKLELPLNIDGKEEGVTPVEFIIKPNALKISLPDIFWKNASKNLSGKEIVKTDKLPSSIERINYLQKKLPFFTHAGEKQYQSLFTTLHDEGKSNFSFIILMLLSAILVTIGLYLNSASIVIGAMLLAPLMHPIVAFSMGLLRQDYILSKESFRTIAIGVLLTLLTAAFIALVLPFEHVTQEMAGRLKPSILDMIVAIISGVAAAYVKNNAKVVGTLAGVAIAVALVPPIATAGIGLGWGDFVMLYQAFLLFLTNLVGIIFAASVVFFMQGFSPMKQAKRGLLYILLIAVIITMPLFDSFVSMVQDAKTISRLEHTTFTIEDKDITLQNISLARDHKIEVIRCELLVRETLNNTQIEKLKVEIEKILGKKVELEALMRIRF